MVSALCYPHTMLLPPHRLYHVWVEGWMTRPDLTPHGDPTPGASTPPGDPTPGDSTSPGASTPPGAYDGWQVLDPTPQDKQSGRYRIGPVPVLAVKHCKVH